MGARIKRWRWAIVIALLLGAALAYSLWPDRVAVDAGVVDRGPIIVGITDDGTTRVHDVYTVSAPVSGYLGRIELEPGDPVVARETVIATMSARLSTPLDQRSRREIESALAAARAGERGAAAALTLAERDLARAEALARQGFVARARLDEARALVATRRALLDQGRAESRRVAALLSEPATSGTPRGGPVAVRAPTSGVVLRLLAESEGAVAEGTPLIEIGDPATMEVVIDLLSQEAVAVEVGNAVDVTAWGGDEPLQGVVRRIEPFGRLRVSALGVEEQRVNVIIALAPESAQRAARLGHGYQVDATIIRWRDDDALRVPIAALFRGDAGWRVFRIEGGRAQSRAVRVGHIGRDHAEVLGGLAAGDRLILNPGTSVSDGIRVQPR